VEVPEVFNSVRVEPGFDMREKAAVDLQMGLQAAHEVENSGAVALAHFFIGIKAQTNVVVAPHANGFDLLKQANRLLDALARLENVAQDNKALGSVLLEHGYGLLQFMVDPIV
jgi:hypothetical protein